MQRPRLEAKHPADRPFRAWPEDALATCFETALAAGDGLTGAHCVHERWMRGEMQAQVEAAVDRLWQRAAASIPDWLPLTYIDWLPAAYDVAGRFRAEGRGRANIYLVLLDYHDSRRGPHGVYVGMSRYPPAVRFDQHKAGIRAAGSVLKRGLEVLTGPVLHLQHIPREQAADIEIALAEALRAAGLLVQGGH